MLPGRLYQGASTATRRYFVHKLPVALDTGRATFVFAQADDETPSGLSTWGGQHAALWAALRAPGRAVVVIVVGGDPVRLDAAGHVLEGWTRAPRVAGAARESAGEIAANRKAVAALDLAALEAWSGLNDAIARCAALEEASERSRPQGPAITAGRTWRCRRVPE